MKNSLKKAIKYLFILALLLWPSFSFAQDLQIQNAKVAIQGEKVIISWNTNILSTGRLDYGLTTTYGNRVESNVYRSEHKIEISGLEEKKLYHYKITAYTPGESISTFDAAFKTDQLKDNQLPKITDVSVVFITSETITIQWKTNEKTGGKVLYGKTDAYGSSAGAGNGILHDVTIYRLTPGAIYHINIEAEDSDKNKARWYDFTVRTVPYKSIENEDLQIYDVSPTTAGDPKIGVDQVTISWHTNKLANGYFAYGTAADKLSRDNEIKDVFRDFSHQTTITKLKPDTTYYFQATSRDIFGKVAKSQIFSIHTQAMPQVLGYRTENNLVDKSVHLIKDVSNGRIYYLYDNQNGSRTKIYIPSPTVFNSYRSNRWSNVVSVSNSVISSYSDVKLVRASGNPAVYLLDGGQKRAFVSATVFEASGYHWSDIKVINQTHLDSIPTGQTIK